MSDGSESAEAHHVCQGIQLKTVTVRECLYSVIVNYENKLNHQWRTGVNIWWTYLMTAGVTYQCSVLPQSAAFACHGAAFSNFFYENMISKLCLWMNERADVY